MATTEVLSTRVVELETLLTHLQHDFEQINRVILEQQSEIESLRSQIDKLEGRVDLLDEEPEDPEAVEERPPHY